MKNGACNIHENAGHVVIATEMYSSKLQILSVCLLKRIKKTQSEVDKTNTSQNATHHHICFPSYGQGINDPFCLLVRGCEQGGEMRGARLLNRSPSLCIQESKINKMWSECLKQAGQETLELPRARIHLYSHQRYTPGSSSIFRLHIREALFAALASKTLKATQLDLSRMPKYVVLNEVLKARPKGTGLALVAFWGKHPCGQVQDR